MAPNRCRRRSNRIQRSASIHAHSAPQRWPSPPTIRRANTDPHSEPAIVRSTCRVQAVEPLCGTWRPCIVDHADVWHAALGRAAARLLPHPGRIDAGAGAHVLPSGILVPLLHGVGPPRTFSLIENVHPACVGRFGGARCTVVSGQAKVSTIRGKHFFRRLRETVGQQAQAKLTARSAPGVNRWSVRPACLVPTRKQAVPQRWQ